MILRPFRVWVLDTSVLIAFKQIVGIEHQWKLGREVGIVTRDASDYEDRVGMVTACKRFGISAWDEYAFVDQIDCEAGELKRPG